jgi:hypothetical protein
MTGLYCDIVILLMRGGTSPSKMTGLYCDIVILLMTYNHSHCFLIVFRNMKETDGSIGMNNA